MLTETEIYTLLEQALAETQRGAAVRHPFSKTLPLLGKDGVFDSLDTMLFLDSVDDLLTAKTGQQITLVNDDALSREESPFRTMETVAAYIAELVREA